MIYLYLTVAVVAVYLLYKLKNSVKDALVDGYNGAVDGTANYISDITGLTEKEQQLEKPIDKQSAGFQALLAVNTAYKNGSKVDETIFKTAYKDYPDYRTVLLAGKQWGYLNWWQTRSL
jgi:hypothetical protein